MVNFTLNLEFPPMRRSRCHFTVRQMMVAVGVAAVAFCVIRWIMTDVIQPREYTYSGNTLISSRRLNSRDYEELEKKGYTKPWYFVEPDPSNPK
jgi:hypothetical protein